MRPPHSLVFFLTPPMRLHNSLWPFFFMRSIPPSSCCVAIVCGGRSSEHEVSLVSAQGIYQGMQTNPVQCVLLAMTKQGDWVAGSPDQVLQHPNDPANIGIAPHAPKVHLTPQQNQLCLTKADGSMLAKVDVCFPIMHGTEGEDGVLQGWLQFQGIPYVGAGVLGSALGMDKDVMKRVLAQAGAPIVPCAVLRDPKHADFETFKQRFGLPLFVKPASLGSSVGVNRVETEAALEEAVRMAFEYGEKVLVEKAIEGRELECAVLGAHASSQFLPQASLFGEIRPAKGGFYSYQAKYLSSTGADLLVPASLSAAQTQQGQQIALRVFEALECEGLARVDFFLCTDDTWVVNEINTLPGFTPISMYPKLWQASGLAYPKLLHALIHLAFERTARHQRYRRDGLPNP